MRRHNQATQKRATSPTYDAYRSMRVPITLIDASSRPAIHDALVSLAASQRNGPCSCVAEHLTQIAAQIRDSYTAAQAIANYTATPAAAAGFTEPAFAETPFGEITFTDPTGGGN